MEAQWMHVHHIFAGQAADLKLKSIEKMLIKTWEYSWDILKNNEKMGLGCLQLSPELRVWLYMISPCWNFSLQKRGGSKSKSSIPLTFMTFQRAEELEQ